MSPAIKWLVAAALVGVLGALAIWSAYEDVEVIGAGGRAGWSGAAGGGRSGAGGMAGPEFTPDDTYFLERGAGRGLARLSDRTVFANKAARRGVGPRCPKQKILPLKFLRRQVART